ncbi:hypothetical protein LSH36_678g02101 [Paralvinella palmiformis]|uniref:Secreted protein n=1 Tax=Paralvinella palmiformis TaxID=53620 RepID=A0AAD9MTR9_9ANNE|nr:hypothetical protein LSH36_678g02101 [Paralvinella palmiformis]
MSNIIIIFIIILTAAFEYHTSNCYIYIYIYIYHNDVTRCVFLKDLIPIIFASNSINILHMVQNKHIFNFFHNCF